MGETVTPVGRILVIDDDAAIGEFVSAVAQSMGLHCLATADAAAAVTLYAPDATLIFLDLRMPGLDGIEVLRQLGDQKCKASVVLISGTDIRVLDTAEKLAQAHGLSIAGHLRKPFRLTELEDVLIKHGAGGAAIPIEHSPRIVIPDEELRAAVANDEFVLHYQPLIEVATERVSGIEALARWQHPERGLIYPDHFIARAETLGLIGELGWLVVKRALAEVGQFDAGQEEHLQLSINVSVRSLNDLKFPDTLSSLAERYSVATRRITLEITESGLLTYLWRSLDVLTRLRMRNVRLSIDDFGTGYAMLQQLENIPATELKIDKIFVQNAQVNASDRVMVQKTIELGHELGMRVIGEGVETREQYDFLRANGCDEVQGYYFSHPLPAAEMVSWLKERRARAHA